VRMVSGSWLEKAKAGPSLRLENGYGQDDGRLWE
jgi:hypothetical protein